MQFDHPLTTLPRTAVARPLHLFRQAGPGPETMERVIMSTFDNPFDRSRRLNSSGCSCGRHIDQIEHERDAVRQLQCEPIEIASEGKRYEGVVASAVMRAIFPKDAARRA